MSPLAPTASTLQLVQLQPPHCGQLGQRAGVRRSILKALGLDQAKARRPGSSRPRPEIAGQTAMDEDRSAVGSTG